MIRPAPSALVLLLALAMSLGCEDAFDLLDAPGQSRGGTTATPEDGGGDSVGTSETASGHVDTEDDVALDGEGSLVEARVRVATDMGEEGRTHWASGTFRREEERYVLDDMLFAPEFVEELDGETTTHRQGLAYAGDDLKWPNGVIPYVIDQRLPNQARVHEAIDIWQSQTRIRLTPRTNEEDYVRFIPGSGCMAYVGRIGGEQTIELADGCTTGSTVHEIGHAVGLWHEQNRPDRDDHVTIFPENIEDGYDYAFRKVEMSFAIGAYDPDSIMHYHSLAFSKNGQPTILLKNGQEIRGQRERLSARDVAGVEEIYASFNGHFADDDGNSHEANIDRIADAGITQGCSKGFQPNFCPSETVTRAEMAVFLSRALNLPSSNVDYFDDDDGAWYEDAANRVAAAGITSGCEERQYCGSRLVTRAQMAVFLARALDLPPASTDAFTDDDGTWYEDAANRVAEAGITLGCATGRYCGEDNVPRDQMASFLARAFLGGS